MRRLFSARVLIYLAVLIILDLTLAPALRLGQSRFILSYLFVLYAAFVWGWNKTLPMALLVGVCRDFFSPAWPGLETFSLAITAFGLDLIVQKLQRELWWLRMAIGFVFVLTVLSIYSFFAVLISDIKLNAVYVIQSAAGSALYTALLLPVFFRMTRRWFHDFAGIRQYELFR